MRDLAEIREEIDGIDREILALFERRMRLAREVAQYKIRSGKPVFDKEREDAKLAALQALVADEDDRYPVKELFAQIMSLSRKCQYALIPSRPSGPSFSKADALPLSEATKVAYFGEPGSYSQQAMLEHFGDGGFQSFPAGTFREVMEAVHQGKADYGVLPIENSSTGGIQDIYDLLTHFDIYIVGEHVVKIEHSLIGIPGAAIDGISRVYSHPQAISQCAAFFEEHPGIEPLPCASTAAAAKRVREEADASAAAIASPKAAAVYGLSILRERLSTQDSNSTRFIILSGKRIFLKDASKVSICFELPHESGSLHNMLSHFICNDLNMTKIESRPLPERPWEYRFFVDFDGNLQDAGVRNCLTGIGAEAAGLRILGNYPAV